MSAVEARQPAPLSAVLVTSATMTLAYTLQRTNGHYMPLGVYLVVATWVAVLAAIAVRGVRVPVAVEWLIGGCIVAQTYLMSVTLPTIEMTLFRDPRQLHDFFVGLFVVAGLTGAAASGRPALGRWWFPLVVGVHFAMGVLVLRLAPSPHIDVFTVEVDSLKALLGGVNPYGITFPDPYGGTSPFFPPGVSVNGRLQFGYVYPPLSLLLLLPGWVLGGDPRYATLAAMTGAALLMGYARPGLLGKLAAVFFLFTPRSFFVLDRAWTDPFVVFLTALVVFVAIRRPKWVWIPAGLYLSIKQHMFIGVPALLLLVPRPMKVRDVAVLGGKSVAVGLGLVLPFFLWSPSAFTNSVLNIREVFRTDSLGLLAHLANQNIATLSKWTGIAAIVPVAAWGLWKAPRSPAGFALLSAATHLTLYLFSTHSFCNEYYNVVGGLCVALAVWDVTPNETVTG